MKKISIGLVISLLAIGCESAKPPVASTPIDTAKMHMQMTAPTAGHMAPAGETKEDTKPADVKPAEGEAKSAEESK